MTRLTFAFSPLDAVDFDVCAGPTRATRGKPAEPPKAEPEVPAPKPEPAPPAKG